ncbi:hypothetical protein I5682_04875 [Citrobacter werkmanii]|nr:hypothetical protein [Citrobacter werkmanii]MBJ9871826.1 hypothetical protein [Citrobacter werkmanii]
MGKMTFVVEFEDGKEPPVSAGMDIAGGRVVAAAWSDYRDDFFTEDERESIAEILEASEFDDRVEEPIAEEIMRKVELLTY